MGEGEMRREAAAGPVRVLAPRGRDGARRGN
jgi:hypothetical protein